MGGYLFASGRYAAGQTTKNDGLPHGGLLEGISNCRFCLENTSLVRHTLVHRCDAFSGSWVKGHPFAAFRFNRALDLESEFPVALNGRGGVLFRRRQYKMAIGDFSAAIRMNPKFVQAYENRANARKATGDLAGTADDFAVVQRLLRSK